MGYRRESEPSPFRTGVVHAGMSLAVFGGLAASLGVGIHVTADPAAASPRQTLALFEVETPAGLAPARTARLGDDLEFSEDFDGEGSFDVAYAEVEGDAVRIEVTGGQGGPTESATDSIRINGRTVRAGESLSQVRRVGGDDAPALRLASAMTQADVAKKPKSKAPADMYARKFTNPEGRPMVGLVVGGLGMSTMQTQLAIDELPADVTLSFALDSKRLDYWVKTARADGHEVLIEVPMEAYDYGRVKMHADTLTTSADAKTNLARLDSILSRTSGYFGVINYQGAKFSADKAAASPVFDRISEKGLIFVDDGSSDKSAFSGFAKSSSLRYARAAGPVDTRQTPADIGAELMDIETMALQKGAAFGSAYAYPVTIEAAQVWISQLDEKGLILAPVSAFANASAPVVRTGSLTTSGLNNGG